jgi:hypothetical protein
MAYCAIQAPSRNGPLDSELKPAGSQKHYPAADRAAEAGVASMNSRWCTTESGRYRVSEDGCLIGGEPG